ncbi:hypothetical protein WKW80_18140 [Variovorax humicola]|uniref:Uncharacterized protein n=1 Tax=Variovorax humicola TaxID=1769758 RepID=A0ABU8W367_9BURK
MRCKILPAAALRCKKGSWFFAKSDLRAGSDVVEQLDAVADERIVVFAQKRFNKRFGLGRSREDQSNIRCCTDGTGRRLEGEAPSAASTM